LIVAVDRRRGSRAGAVTRRAAAGQRRAGNHGQRQTTEVNTSAATNSDAISLDQNLLASLPVFDQD